MPVYHRKDRGVWEVVIYHAGQVHRRSSRGWSKAQAREVEAKLRRELFEAGLGKKPDRTFNEAVERWLKEEVPRMRPRSAKEARQNAVHIAPFLEGRGISDAKEIAAEIRGAWPHLSPSTVNRRLAVLSRLCRLAEAWGWVDGAPRIPLLRESQREMFLTKDQVMEIAERCGPHRDAVLLSAYTGIRIGHLLRLTKADYADGKIMLDRSSKTGAPQVIPVHPVVQPIAKRLPLSSGYQGFYKAFRKACGEIGVVARPHDLRHTFASWLVQNDAEMGHVQKLLGHSSI